MCVNQLTLYPLHVYIAYTGLVEDGTTMTAKESFL